MKKRILSFMLVLAMSFSLGAVFTFAADDTGPVTGMTASELKTQIQGFVQTANGLIKRDDWEKIPGASNLRQQQLWRIRENKQRPYILRGILLKWSHS